MADISTGADDEDEDEDEDEVEEDEEEDDDDKSAALPGVTPPGVPPGGAPDANACVVRNDQTCGRLNAARNDLLTSWHLLAARAGA